MSLSMYNKSRSKVIRNSNAVAAMYFGLDATAKHTNATSRLT